MYFIHSSTRRPIISTLLVLATLTTQNVASTQTTSLESLKDHHGYNPTTKLLTSLADKAVQKSNVETINLTSSFKVVASTPEQPPGARWRLVSDVPTAWRSLEQSLDVKPDSYTLEFEAVQNFNTPPSRQFNLVGGVSYSIPATYTPYLSYKVGDIPPLFAKHGEPFNIFIEKGIAGATSTRTVTISPNEAQPKGAINLRANDGLFTYTPDSTDLQRFELIFRETASGQPTIEQRVKVYPTRAPVRAELDNFKRELATNPDSDFYISVTDNFRAQDAKEFLNGREQQVRDVVVSGIEIVLSPDSIKNALWTKLHSDVFRGNDNIATLSIYCETLKVEGALKIPGTKLTIHARKLVFEDKDSRTASIDNTPYKPTKNTAGNGAPAVPGAANPGMEIYVEEVIIPSTPSSETKPARLIAKGGNGGDATDGRNGNPGQALNYNANNICRNGEFSGRVIWQGSRETGNDPCGRVDGGDPNGLGNKFEVAPNAIARSRGEDAVPSSRPGDGGRGGVVKSTLNLTSIVSNGGGVAGAIGSSYTGGNAGNQSPVYKLCGCIGEADHTSEAIYIPNGANAAPPAAAIPVGAAGTVETINAPVAWINPKSLNSILLYARDLYRNRNIEATRRLLLDYASAIDGARAGLEPAGKTLDDDTLAVYAEIKDLLFRAENGIDYFGAPATWVPTLSFEVNKAAFEEEIQASLPILYATYWLQTKADTRAKKEAGLQALAQRLSEDTDSRIQDYVDIQQEINTSLSTSLELDNEIFITQNQANVRFSQLEEDASNNVKVRNYVPGWKRAAKIVGTVMTVLPIPAAQPALAAIGTGLQMVSSIDTNKPVLDQAYGAVKGGFKAYGDSQYAKNAQDFVGALESFGETPNEQTAKLLYNQVKGFGDKMASVIDDTTAAFKKVEAPRNEVEAELARLAASDPEYAELLSKVSQVNEEKERLYRSIALLQSQASETQTAITTNLRALDEIGRSLTALGDYSHEALNYLKRIDQRSRDRLLRYQYSLAQSFEYRFLDEYRESFNLDRLTSELQNIAALDSDGVLTPTEFSNASIAYIESLRATVARAIELLNNLPAPSIQQSAEIVLTEDEIEQLNGPLGYLEIDLARRALPRGIEQARLIKVELKELSGARISGGGSNSSISFRHTGTSELAVGSKIYRFVHSGADSGSGWTWSANYNWRTGAITNAALGINEQSLIRTLINSLSEGAKLFAEPGASTKIRIEKEDVGDVQSRVDFLAFDVTYSGYPVSSNAATLSVSAITESGVPILGLRPLVHFSRADNGGRESGYANFTRIFPKNRSINVTAEQRYGRYEFSGWESQGVVVSQKSASSPTASITLSNNAQLTAKYRLVEEASIIGDANSDGRVDDVEILTFIDQWVSQTVTDEDLLTAINNWVTSNS